MDLSNLQIKTISLAIQNPRLKIVDIQGAQKRAVRLHSLENHFRFEIKGIIDHHIPVSGTAAAKNAPLALVKAFAELGENCLTELYHLPHREGMAARFFLKNAIARAQAEALERDAFLYHWKNQIPFKFVDQHGPLRFFELDCLDPKVQCVLVTDFCESSQCVIFGTAAGTDSLDTRFRAQEEFERHRSIQIGGKHYCATAMSDSNTHPNINGWSGPFFHHIQSRTEPCRDRFRRLCEDKPWVGPRSTVDLQQTGGSRGTDDSKRAIRWQIESFPSPIRFLKFAQVSSPDLQQLRFFEPDPATAAATETATETTTEPPVFHPFW